jgi:hypothetical protein
MLSKLKGALPRRHAAVVEAKQLVWQRGARGVALARAAAADPHQDEDRRQHDRLVAVIAERRLAELDGLDTATAYEVGDRWARRRGSLIAPISVSASSPKEELTVR